MDFDRRFLGDKSAWNEWAGPKLDAWEVPSRFTKEIWGQGIPSAFAGTCGWACLPLTVCAVYNRRNCDSRRIQDVLVKM